MKTLFSAFGGALTLTEQAGVLSLNGDESLGGGQAAGIVKGQFSLQVDAGTALKLGEALLNAKLPASAQALAAVVETVVNQAVAALE